MNLEPISHVAKNPPEPSNTMDAPPDVAAILEQVGALQRRSTALALMLGGSYLLFWLTSWLSGPHSFWHFISALFFVFIAATTCTGTFLNNRKIAALQKQFVYIDDVQHISHVIRALGSNLISPDKTLVSTLVNLLLKVRSSDARFITPGNRLILNDFLRDSGTRLKMTDRHRLILAILKALEQVGDETAIAPVTLLGKASSPEVRAAAQECLPYLYQRADEQRAGQGLLRPSDKADTPDVLLRPAVATPDAAPEQLLRAINGDAPRV